MTIANRRRQSAVRRTVAPSGLADARTCYDHLAGRLGVGIADVLIARGHIVLAGDDAAITNSGRQFFEALGVDPAAVPGRRPCCRACLDWTERRPHLAGKLGSALAQQFLARGLIERQRGSRALTVTPAGRRRLFEIFGLEF